MFIVVFGLRFMLIVLGEIIVVDFLLMFWVSKDGNDVWMLFICEVCGYVVWMDEGDVFG